jgi:hypothetical protein
VVTEVFFFLGGLRAKTKEYHLIRASFASIASDPTTMLTGRRLAILRLIHFLIKVLFNDEATGIHFIS